MNVENLVEEVESNTNASLITVNAKDKRLQFETANGEVWTVEVGGVIHQYDMSKNGTYKAGVSSIESVVEAINKL